MDDPHPNSQPRGAERVQVVQDGLCTKPRACSRTSSHLPPASSPCRAWDLHGGMGRGERKRESLIEQTRWRRRLGRVRNWQPMVPLTVAVSGRGSAPLPLFLRPAGEPGAAALAAVAASDSRARGVRDGQRSPQGPGGCSPSPAERDERCAHV